MDAIKLEGGSPSRITATKAIIEAGVAVMGHVGLTPSSPSCSLPYSGVARYLLLLCNSCSRRVIMVFFYGSVDIDCGVWMVDVVVCWYSGHRKVVVF
ncbi:hypothetical protein Tsubulata_017704 [Turnera subulata]|uniref:3-methyl-2-oxobutanoate hydroxymethyltransferase n=1 Tax=Turnera subulata TaxID=218843 RepID=A0A9Q0FS61_9ROSI|nr:hypothetical protein Tsubulata_017704 [Turnera subulata]